MQLQLKNEQTLHASLGVRVTNLRVEANLAGGFAPRRTSWVTIPLEQVDSVEVGYVHSLLALVLGVLLLVAWGIGLLLLAYWFLTRRRGLFIRAGSSDISVDVPPGEERAAEELAQSILASRQALRLAEAVAASEREVPIPSSGTVSPTAPLVSELGHASSGATPLAPGSVLARRHNSHGASVSEQVCDCCGQWFVEFTRKFPTPGISWTALLEQYSTRGVCPSCFHTYADLHKMTRTWESADWSQHVGELVRTATTQKELGEICNAYEDKVPSIEALIVTRLDALQATE